MANELPRLHTEKQAAFYLNCSVKFLQKLRRTGGGPQWVKLGRMVRYPTADLDSYVSNSVRSSTSAKGTG